MRMRSICPGGARLTLVMSVALVNGALIRPGQCDAPPAKARVAAVKAEAAPRPAPALAFPDTSGKPRALKDYLGRPVALFFFCGCGLCHKCAQSWSAMQRSGALSAMAPQTLIVFHGDADEARGFVGDTQLDPKQTVVMVDPEGKGSTLYRSEECPRIFVVDPQGRVRYTNNEQGAASYKIPAPLIVARAMDHLRAIAPKAGRQAPPKAAS